MSSIQRRDSYICHRRHFISFSFLSSSIQFSDHFQSVFFSVLFLIILFSFSFPSLFLLFSLHFRTRSLLFSYHFPSYSFPDFTITVSSRNQIRIISKGYFIFLFIFQKSCSEKNLFMFSGIFPLPHLIRNPERKIIKWQKKKT